MGRVGAAGNKATIENFLLLQKHVLDRQVWATRMDLRRTIVNWIAPIYHRRRRQDSRD